MGCESARMADVRFAEVTGTKKRNVYDMEKILGDDTFYDFSYFAIMYYADRKFDGIYVKK